MHTARRGAQFAGTRLSSAGHGAVISSVTPGFILVFAAALLKERITWVKVAAVGIATAGVLVVAEQPGGFRLEARAFWGDLLLLVAGITWALYTVLGRLAANRYPPVTARFLLGTAVGNAGGVLATRQSA